MFGSKVNSILTIFQIDFNFFFLKNMSFLLKSRRKTEKRTPEGAGEFFRLLIC